ncbi:MAG: hypothetical protein Q7R83_03620 [bacterium]|nr:hypothetical protein [bacterium]
MDERLSSLLKTVIEDYVATAEPVGSQHLVEQYDLGVSSATIRNWFSALEEQGYLTQPHTSGGRLPTEKGFLYYVEHFIQTKPPSKKDREALEKAANVVNEEGRRLKNIAKALAELSGEAAVVGFSDRDTFYTGLSQLFAQPEFRHWENVISLSELLDRLDETLHRLSGKTFTEPRILLGAECPFGPGCASILASTEGGLIGILGPLRMDYQQIYSLVSTAIKIY